jgi:hypothetical protein
MQQAFCTWLRRHPDDGRYVLCNGYDWTYLTVEDAPFQIRRVWLQPQGLWAELSDGSEELLELGGLRSGRGDALYVPVKAGLFEARFTPQAQTALLPLVVEAAEGEPALEVAGVIYPVAGLGADR